MRYFFFLLVLLALPIASSLTVQQGVEFTYDNVTIEFTNQVIDLDNITLGDDWFGIDADNWSFRPGAYDLNISVDDYTDKRTNTLYMVGESQAVAFNILAEGDTAAIIIGGEDYLATFTSPATNTLWSYYNEYNLTLVFRDELTKNLITSVNVSISIIGDIIGANYTTDSGNQTINNLVEDDYIIQYGAPGYVTRNYYFNYLTSTNATITLYLINNSLTENVTINVYDHIGFRVVDAEVEILKYFENTHSYELVEMCKTNFQGGCVVSMILNTEYYKFFISNEGTQVYTSVPTIVYANTLNFYINEYIDYINDVFDQFGLIGTISFIPSTDTAIFNYNDEDNSATQGCVVAYDWSTGSRVVSNSTCISTSSGTVTTKVANVSGTTYEFIGVIVKNGINYLVDSTFYTYDEDEFNQQSGLWLLFLVMGVVALTFFINPLVGVVLTSVVPLIFTITRLYNMGYEVAVGVFVTGIVIAVIMGRNQ